MINVQLPIIKLNNQGATFMSSADKCDEFCRRHYEEAIITTLAFNLELALEFES